MVLDINHQIHRSREPHSVHIIKDQQISKGIYGRTNSLRVEDLLRLRQTCCYVAFQRVSLTLDPSLITFSFFDTGRAFQPCRTDSLVSVRGNFILKKKASFRREAPEKWFISVISSLFLGEIT